MIRFSNAETIRIECDERGFEMIIQTEDSEEIRVNVQQAADALYESVIQYVQPWIYEREQAFAEFRQAVRTGTGPAAEYFACNPDESAGMADEYAVAIREDGSLRMEHDEDAYDPSDPKHRDFHSVHADIWDARAGK